MPPLILIVTHRRHRLHDHSSCWCRSHFHTASPTALRPSSTDRSSSDSFPWLHPRPTIATRARPFDRLSMYEIHRVYLCSYCVTSVSPFKLSDRGQRHKTTYACSNSVASQSQKCGGPKIWKSYNMHIARFVEGWVGAGVNPLWFLSIPTPKLSLTSHIGFVKKSKIHCWPPLVLPQI